MCRAAVMNELKPNLNSSRLGMYKIKLKKLKLKVNLCIRLRNVIWIISCKTVKFC